MSENADSAADLPPLPMTVASPLKVSYQCQTVIGVYPNKKVYYPSNPQPGNYWFLAINRYTLNAVIAAAGVPEGMKRDVFRVGDAEKPLHAEHGQERVSWGDYEAAANVLRGWDEGRSIVGVNFNFYPSINEATLSFHGSTGDPTGSCTKVAFPAPTSPRSRWFGRSQCRRSSSHKR